MEFIKKAWPILAAVLLGIILIVVDVCVKPQSAGLGDSEEDYEEYARQLVESSTIKVGDSIYHGVFSGEEISELPEGFTLYGEISECVGLDGELVKDLSSNSISEGYPVYTNPNSDSIYLRVTTDEDQFQSYVEYVK